MKTAFLIFLFLVSPFFASANVIINEVAWMGSDNGGTARQNANDEWMELYNNSSQAVSLDDWIMEIVGSKEIDLKGEISPGGYYLIERTNDDSVPNVAADVAVSFGRKGLKNTGSILILKNASGNEIQKIDAQNGWPAGNNESKETMQWNGVLWITATPTPKALNAGLSLVTENDSASEDLKQPNQTDEDILKTPVSDKPIIQEKPKAEPEPKAVPIETKFDLAKNKPVARELEKESETKAKQVVKKEVDEKKDEAVVKYDDEVSTGGAVVPESVDKEEIAETDPSSSYEMEQTASVVSAVSDTVRGANEWLTLVLLLGILAGIGSLFIRG